MLSDVVFALRTLRRRRAFTAIAVATIALGIGAATSIYSVVDGVLFRPLPFAQPGQLVAIWQTFPHWRGDPILDASWDRISFSLPEVADLRAQQTSFADVAAWSTTTFMLGGAERTEQVRAVRATASMLQVLRAAPVVGRNFLPAEDVVGGAPVVLLSHEAWQTRFQGRRDVIGEAMRLDELPYTIVGVLPAGLTLNRTVSADGLPPFWVPLFQDSVDTQRRNNRSYTAVARLKPGVSLAAAAAETERILQGEDPPERKDVRLQAWQADQTRTVRAPLLLLLGAAGLLLLIACVNVAILTLGEASGREGEITARVALGARPGRIVGQLLTESVVLSGAGAVAGIALAWAGTRVLVALAPPRIPGIAEVGIDLRVLAFALAACVATGLAFGLAPALSLARSAPGQVFRGSAGQSARGRGSLQRTLVAVELALSLVMLVGAGLLTRSFERLTAVDPGFRPDSVLVVRVALPRQKFADTLARRQFFLSAAERLGAVPGVAAVTGTSNVPFEGSSSTSIQIEGRPLPTGVSGIQVQQRTVLPNFFEVLRIPVTAGRPLLETDREGAPAVIVISESLARSAWPGRSPVGEYVQFQGVRREIIGVVGDVRHGKLSDDVQATVYVPLAQRAFRSLNYLVRTSGDPASVIAGARAALFELEPMAPVTNTEPLRAVIRRTMAEERYRTALISLFGVVAAALAAIGLYGVTARAVARRTREMGIRLALGATPGGITALVLRFTLAGMAAGLALGLLASTAATRALEPYLFGVSTSDGVALGGSVALLLGIGALATWIPARRAARVPAAEVLRGE